MNESIDGKTKGYKSTEFYVSIVTVVVCVAVIIAEIANNFLHGESLGVDIQHILYVILGTNLGYTGSRTIKKSNIIKEIINRTKVSAEVEMSRKNSNNTPIDDNLESFEEDLPGFYQEEEKLNPEKEQTTRISPLQKEDGFRTG